MPGMLIAVEGIDFAGKSTLCRLLKLHLYARPDFAFSYEPGDSPLGDVLRNILLPPNGADPVPMTAKSRMRLYATSQSEKYERYIGPRREQGLHTLVDRWAGALFAYNWTVGLGRAPGGFDSFRESFELPLADLTLMLKARPAIARARSRRASDENFLDRRDIKFYEAIEQALDMWHLLHNERSVVIDAEQSPADVLRQALVVLKDRVPNFDPEGRLVSR